MELKSIYRMIFSILTALLIVPYGIEMNIGYEVLSCRPSFNRTLWNWNHTVVQTVMLRQFLLIVPYGIEIRTRCGIDCFIKLLIVPYGIEITNSGKQAVRLFPFNRTLWNWNTINEKSWDWLSPLLIVPYGIEISSLCFPSWRKLSFNRTLWNWNMIPTFFSASIRFLLIVPYGIEITSPCSMTYEIFLLIVPYGIEIRYTEIPVRPEQRF